VQGRIKRAAFLAIEAGMGLKFLVLIKRQIAQRLFGDERKRLKMVFELARIILRGFLSSRRLIRLPFSRRCNRENCRIVKLVRYACDPEINPAGSERACFGNQNDLCDELLSRSKSQDSCNSLPIETDRCLAVPLIIFGTMESQQRQHSFQPGPQIPIGKPNGGLQNPCFLLNSSESLTSHDRKRFNFLQRPLRCFSLSAVAFSHKIGKLDVPDGAKWQIAR
jgi:hypothetical protein